MTTTSRRAILAGAAAAIPATVTGLPALPPAANTIRYSLIEQHRKLDAALSVMSGVSIMRRPMKPVKQYGVPWKICEADA